jgi:hypothetical protein
MKFLEVTLYQWLPVLETELFGVFVEIMEFENLQELLSGSIYCEKTHFFVILMVFCFEGFFRSL